MPGFATQALCFSGTKALDPSDAADRYGPSEPEVQIDEDGNENVCRTFTSSIIPGLRVKGGNAPGPKPIRADYDTDDGRIVELKQMGHTDEQVAQRLIKEGRVRYSARTVGSRWTRLRKALEAKEEEILDDELSDWHVGDDELLEQAVDEIDQKLEREIARIRAKKWAQVASHVADLLQKRKYTSKACKERFDGLLDGTALKPIELDSDQEGRATMRINRIAANKRARAEAAEVLNKELEAKKKKREDKVQAKERAKTNRTTRKDELMAERTALGNMKKEALEQRKLKKETIAQWTAYHKAELTWQRRKAQAEAKLRNMALGLPASTRPHQRKAAMKEREAVFSGADSSEDEMPELDDDPENDGDAETSDEESEGEDIVVVVPVRNKHRREVGSGSDNPAPKKKGNPRSLASRRSPAKSKSASPKPEPIAPGTVAATRETLLNPRSVMTSEELDVLLHLRKLPKQTASESHAQVVARLAQEDYMLSMHELEDMLKEATERCTGNKADRIVRIQLYDAENSAAGSMGIKASSLTFKATYEGYREVDSGA